MRGGHSRAALSALGLLASLVGGPAPARAQVESRLALHWVRGPGAETCVDGTALAGALEARLGRPVFGPAAEAEAWLEGQVTARPQGGFVASLRWVDADGTRPGTRTLTSDAATCDELSESVALVLAVMIDPDAALQQSEPEAESPPPPPVESTPEPAAEQAPVPAQQPLATEAKPAPDARHAAGAVARVGLASLPTAQVGLGVFYALDLPHAVRLRVEAIAFGRQNLQVDPQGAELSLQPLSLAVSACPLLASGKGLALGLCGGAMGGLLLQDARGLDQGGDRVLGTLELHAGLRGYWEAERVRLGVGAAFSVALVRQQLYVLDGVSGERDFVYDQGTFGAAIDATVAVRF